MQGQTHLDVQRGIEAIKDLTMHVVHSDDDVGKVRLVTDAGALGVVAEIEEMAETIRQLVLFDSGASSPTAPKRLRKFLGLECGN